MVNATRPFLPCECGTGARSHVGESERRARGLVRDTPVMERDALRELFAAAEADPVAQAAREQLCRTLAQAFARVGLALWTGGALIGGDRPGGLSPFGFGSDATVGLATIIQIAGELTAGAIGVLEHDNLYAAAALIRQLVEVEYLAWAFGSDEQEAERWLRSTPNDRMKMWQPRHIRKRSDGRFRGSDYSGHCERGGHPTPTALSLLPDHSARESGALWWFDLASHGVSVWRYIPDAVSNLGWADHVPEAATKAAVSRDIERWEARDELPSAIAAVRRLDGKDTDVEPATKLGPAHRRP
jgi:hypothetical protein